MIFIKAISKFLYPPAGAQAGGGWKAIIYLFVYFVIS